IPRDDEGSFLTTFTPDAAATLGGPDWFRARRLAAAERFAAGSLPDATEEIWRYSRISELDLDAYRPALGAPEAGAGPGPVPEVPGDRAAMVVVHNGRPTRIDVDPALTAKGLVVADASDLPDGDDMLGLTPVADAFTELNTAFLPGVTVVRIPRGMVIDQPIVIVHHLDGDGIASFSRTVVLAGENSDATVIEHQSSSDVVAFSDPVVELDVGDAARLRYLNVQDLGPRVFQVGYQSSRVGRDATLQSSVVALGGDYARVRTDSRIDGKGGTSYLTAVYFADGSRMHDFRTIQDHIAPKTTSDLLFKGAVSDTARSVYSGLIRIGKEARGTNAYQTNRNLVLSEGAGAESVPNLEIETNDVICSHASAVGPIDDEQRYYLESRGIPPEVAERLIVLGFFGEVLDRLPASVAVTGLRAALVRRLAERASGAGPA
ncbi:MAG TPA: Fe-S cluster assembly protein SufD, partial [Acidimicrobiales bacterium]|nr:Fe-S cluster assembly protein SufD [Acidimicrobiales bacterium]